MFKQHEEVLLYNIFFFFLMCISDTDVISLLGLLLGPGMVKLKMCSYSVDLFFFFFKFAFNALLCGP